MRSHPYVAPRVAESSPQPLQPRILDIFDFALNGHILYWYLVTNYTNPLALQGKVVWFVSISRHPLRLPLTPADSACVFLFSGAYRYAHLSILGVPGEVVISSDAGACAGYGASLPCFLLLPYAERRCQVRR